MNGPSNPHDILRVLGEKELPSDFCRHRVRVLPPRADSGGRAATAAGTAAADGGGSRSGSRDRVRLRRGRADGWTGSYRRRRVIVGHPFRGAAGRGFRLQAEDEDTRRHRDPESWCLSLVSQPTATLVVSSGARRGHWFGDPPSCKRNARQPRIRTSGPGTIVSDRQ